MIKVLQVSSDTNIGGAGKCILTYLKNFDKMKIDTAVVLPKNSLLKKEVATLGVKVFEIDAMADKSLDFKAVKKLLAVFKELGYEIELYANRRVSRAYRRKKQRRLYYHAHRSEH